MTLCPNCVMLQKADVSLPTQKQQKLLQNTFLTSDTKVLAFIFIMYLSHRGVHRRSQHFANMLQ